MQGHLCGHEAVGALAWAHACWCRGDSPGIHSETDMTCQEGIFHLQGHVNMSDNMYLLTSVLVSTDEMER